MNGRNCDVCDIDVQRASYAKHLRSKKIRKRETDCNDNTGMSTKYIILNH